MIETIALWIGYIIMLFLALSLVAILIWFTYTMYDYWLKKILKWENVQVRKDIFYFMKHKAEIQDYIKNKSSSNSSSAKAESFIKIKKMDNWEAFSLFCSWIIFLLLGVAYTYIYVWEKYGIIIT